MRKLGVATGREEVFCNDQCIYIGEAKSMKSQFQLQRKYSGSWVERQIIPHFEDGRCDGWASLTRYKACFNSEPCKNN